MYENPLLNDTALLSAAIKSNIGVRGVDALIELGEDEEVAKMLIEASEEYGPKHVIEILFSSSAVVNNSGAFLQNIEYRIDVAAITEDEQDNLINLVGES